MITLQNKDELGCQSCHFIKLPWWTCLRCYPPTWCDSEELQSASLISDSWQSKQSVFFLSDLYKVSVSQPRARPKTVILLLPTGQGHWGNYFFGYRSAKAAFRSLGDPESTGRCDVASDRAGSAHSLGARLDLQVVSSSLWWPCRASDSEQRNQKSQRPACVWAHHFWGGAEHGEKSVFLASAMTEENVPLDNVVVTLGKRLT